MLSRTWSGHFASLGCSLLQDRIQIARQAFGNLEYGNLQNALPIAIRNAVEMLMLPCLDHSYANRWQHSQMPRHFPRVFE
jgi:hypothetical protein